MKILKLNKKIQTKETEHSIDIQKNKVTSAEIVVHGTINKPYYEIKYCLIGESDCHIGYSSYNLNYVFEWLEKYFEIIH